jgi:phospholipid/cholesterol/gamma-HCH transport system ATP-binding protein
MADSSARVAMRVDDLVVAFGDRVVLDHLSIDVVRGEIIGLVGASGGGKSVLLRAILGLLPTRGGRIEILGVDRDQMNAEELQALERRWGVLYQQGALFSSLTVFQNIEFPMREYLKLSPRLMREVATAKLEMVGISPEEGDKYPAALSGG